MTTATLPPGAKQSAMVTNGRKRVHTTFPDGTEMVEEFDIQTDQLLVRRRRAKTVIGRETDWVYEVGIPPERKTIAHDTLAESSSNPVFSRGDRIDCFEWRVRNLPYPKSTYSVSVDGDQRVIVVRTSNKKYFKRITVEDLDRLSLPLDEKALSWDHANSTLIISYRKPPQLVQAERDAAAARRKLGNDEAGQLQDGEVAGCPQQ